MNNLSPSSWGALSGLLLGLLIILLPLSKVLLIVLLVLLGYTVGKLIESQELRHRIRELFSLLFH